MEPAQFVDEIARVFPDLREVAVGEGWTFGKNRAGTTDRLSALADKHGFSVNAIPPVMYDGTALTEGYVEAFGVDPNVRRRGVGTALQEQARRQCQAAGCYQMRSRSPVTSTENYALKIAAGYVVQPSTENDSYYFLVRL